MMTTNLPLALSLSMNRACRADIPVCRCGRLSSRPVQTPDWKVRCTGRLESLPYVKHEQVQRVVPQSQDRTKGSRKSGRIRNR